MAKYSVGFVVPLLILALSIPLILGKVSANGSYGFRTPKTLSSDDVWYPANRAEGWFMLAAAVLSIFFNLALWWTVPEWSPSRTVLWMTAGNMILLSTSLLASFIYLGRL